MNSLVADVTLWGHALAAFMFALLVGWQSTVRGGGARRVLLMLACAFTGLWCAGVARVGIGAITPSIAKNMADLSWLGWLLVLQPPVRGDRRLPIIIGIYVLIVTMIAAAIVLKLLPFLFGGSPRIQEGLFLAGHALRAGIAASALCLLHNFFTAAPPEARWRLGMPMLALAAMWIFDLNLALVAYLTEDMPRVLYAVRGLFLVLAAPLLVTVSRLTELDRMRPPRASRFEMLSLAVMAFYLVLMLAIDKILVLGGNRWRLGQVTIALFFLLFAGALFPSERLRKALKAALARHLFQHRYDYRLEWRRFTETVGEPGDAAPPIAERVIKAIADIPDCPGGVLLLRGSRWRARSVGTLRLARTRRTAGRGDRRTGGDDGARRQADRACRHKIGQRGPRNRRHPRMDGGGGARLADRSADPFRTAGRCGAAGGAACSPPARLGGP